MIKKIFITTLMTLATVAVLYGQEYQKLRIGIGMGYSASRDGGGGLLYTLEPGYHLNDDLVFGIRFEGVGAELDGNGFNKGYKSLTANAQYYVGNKFRMFVGAGLGYYKVRFDGGRDSSFGFYPRAGFDFGHGFLALDYNVVPTVVIGDYTYHNSYLSIRLGVNVGGGKQ